MNLFIRLVGDSGPLKEDLANAAKVVKEGAEKLGTAAKEGSEKATKGNTEAKKSVESLRKSYRAAMLDAQKLAGAYGLGHAATREAAARAADFKDQMEDVNDLINASHPDAPFKAMNNVLSSSASVFAGVQGAMAMVGDENENLQKTFLKLQAAMAMAQGIEAIVKAKDAFRDLGFTITGPVVQSLGAMKIALIATGIGALVVAVGMLAAHFENVADKASTAEQAMIDAAKVDAENWANRNRALSESANTTDEYYNQLKEKEILRAKIAGASEERIFQIEVKYEQLRAERYKQARDQMKAGSAERLAMNEKYWAQVNRIEVMHLERELERIEKLKKAREEADRLKITVGPLAARPMRPIPTKDLKLAAQEITAGIEQIEYKGPQMVNHWVENMQKMKAATADFAANGIGTLAESIGTALGSGNWDGVFNSVIATFADFLKQLGGLLIAYGLAQAKFASALALGPAGAPLAIAAGASLIVAGAAIKALLSKQAGGAGSGGGNGGGAGGFNGYRATPFAEGGIVSGPTFALVGEYRGARNNPEVIAPLDKLRSMLGNMGVPQIVPAMRLSGQDILITFDRSNARRNRF